MELQQNLTCRIQLWGGHIHYSQKKIYTCDHNPNPWAGNHLAIQAAYVENDYPRFKKKYDTLTPDIRPLNYFNWMEQDNIWHRRLPFYTNAGLCE